MQACRWTPQACVRSKEDAKVLELINLFQLTRAAGQARRRKRSSPSMNRPNKAGRGAVIQAKGAAAAPCHTHPSSHTF
ncbi:g6223 [Coccomyxa elongata]